MGAHFRGSASGSRACSSTRTRAGSGTRTSAGSSTPLVLEAETETGVIVPVLETKDESPVSDMLACAHVLWNSDKKEKEEKSDNKLSIKIDMHIG